MAAQGELSRLMRRFRALKSESMTKTFTRGVDKLLAYGYAPLAKRQAGGRSFSFLGQRYPYFIHPYNSTWRNERVVEVALALRFLEQIGSRSLLELGNVLSYYSNVPHPVIDRYEDSPGVANVDFVDCPIERRYECFLSISTFEHIGWDETPRRPAKVEEAFARVRSFLTEPSTGDVLITIPIGYNQHLDDLIGSSRIVFPRQGALIRTDAANNWEEVDIRVALERQYGSPFVAANALFVGYGVPEVRRA
jgi:hypothetical protein